MLHVHFEVYNFACKILLENRQIVKLEIKEELLRLVQFYHHNMESKSLFVNKQKQQQKIKQSDQYKNKQTNKQTNRLR